MAVDVDDRILRARHGMLGHDERRLGLVFADRRLLELRLAPFRRPGANLTRRLLSGQERNREQATRRGEDQAFHVDQTSDFLLQTFTEKESQRAVSRIL